MRSQLCAPLRAPIRARLIAVFVLAMSMIGRADDSASPQSVFENKGLSVSDNWLVLSYESGVHDEVGKVKESAQAVHIEATSRRDLRFEILQDRRDLEGLLDNLVDADNQINGVIATRARMSQDDPNYPAVIDQYNTALKHRDALSSQIDDLEKGKDDAVGRLGEIVDSRSEYTNLTMEAAIQAESVARVYEALSHDPDLAQAIAGANAAGNPPLKLGPSPTFSADLELLRQAVKDVVDSPIPVRRDPADDELYVKPVLNDTVTDEMIWDSGAATVTLSTRTIGALGITLSDQDPTIDAEMPGGIIQKVHVVILKSIRLGGFTIRNVPCMVMPDSGDGHADDLLGDTFQSHFISRMDQRSQQLQLTPIDSSVIVGAVPRELGGR